MSNIEVIEVIKLLNNIEKIFIKYCNLLNYRNKNKNNYLNFSQFILKNLNNNNINLYISILNKCNCCKRHTGCDDHLDLKKPVDYLNVKVYECDCNCRHYKRNLQLSLNYLK
jgi:hypothetical protein